MICGCGAESGAEVDGEEFEIHNLHELVEILEEYNEVHLNYFKGGDDIDLWIKVMHE